MVSKELIERLGFDAWADNEYMNLIENFVTPGTGRINIDATDCAVRLEWTDESIHCVLRAYTHEGWREYEKTVKR